MTGWAGWQHAACGHAPLPVAEDIQWRCRRLAIGAGAAGALARGRRRRGRYLAPDLLNRPAAVPAVRFLGTGVTRAAALLPADRRLGAAQSRLRRQD